MDNNLSTMWKPRKRKILLVNSMPMSLHHIHLVMP
jgi:hypothetical protein